jgi:hypothetical protein
MLPAAPQLPAHAAPQQFATGRGAIPSGSDAVGKSAQVYIDQGMPREVAMARAQLDALTHGKKFKKDKRNKKAEKRDKSKADKQNRKKRHRQSSVSS